ncbi:MAG: 4Fe-4S ferredoxin, partial [Desulfobacteraceae bacterium]
MRRYTEEIRKKAGNLLKEGKVDLVLGYAGGSVPMMNRPILIRRPEEADQLLWDGFCSLNLANYLTGRKEKIGVIANGCNSRNIVNHIVENQVKREQLHILGMPCEGMIDRRLVARAAGGKDILAVTEENGTVTVDIAGSPKQLGREDLLQQNCRTCAHRNPVVYDEMIGNPVEERNGLEPYADVAAIEAMAPAERWEYFSRLVSGCIRCYACRNACPLCYCPTCFVDDSRPQWVGKGSDPVDTMTFHLLRAYHCA